MTKNPIISLSLPKSGTTTLAEALRIAGLKVADWRVRRHETDNTAIHDKLVATMMYEDYFTHGDPLHRLTEFDAITEMNAVNFRLSLWPQTDFALLSAIEAHYPAVRFILCKRDPERLANSILGWNNLGKERLPKNDVPGLPRPFGADSKDLIRWIEGHYAFCDRMFEGRKNYLAYQLEDTDAPQRIAAFLDLDLPWWGKANTTEDWLATQRQEG